jgi:nitrite reductase/ring-hydroxylating ferredoxin subunit
MGGVKMDKSSIADSVGVAADAGALDVIGVGTVSELVEGGRQIFVNAGSREILVVAVGERIFAMSGRCPHRSARLDHWGELRSETCEMFCKLHAWTFSLQTGEEVTPWPWPEFPREEREPLQLYSVIVRGRHVFVGVPTEPRQ